MAQPMTLGVASRPRHEEEEEEGHRYCVNRKQDLRKFSVGWHMYWMILDNNSVVLISHKLYV
jgi:hypothetical protein